MTRTTRLKTVLVGIGVTGAAVAGIALAGPSLASAADPSTDPSASASASSGTPSADHAADRAKRQDELATALAAELGVDKDKVAAALAKIESERAANRPARPEGGQGQPGADATSRLDAAVAAGTITQAEADAVKKAMEAGVLRGGPHGGPPK